MLQCMLGAHKPLGKNSNIDHFESILQINSFSQDGTTFGGLFCYS